MPKTKIIRGLPFPGSPWFTIKNIEDTLDFVPSDGDIVIASYPKTGTTWLQYSPTNNFQRRRQYVVGVLRETAIKQKGRNLENCKISREEYFASLSEDDELMEKVLEHTTFDYMKKNLYLITRIRKKKKGIPEKSSFSEKA
ncbi:sulfotransferase family cytosolic 1B member 1 [Caerostris extrusa]|uniref:Sulfotransferase family cytosolic 1B member 1 n=1 Tax=Caerostris extrusa TaxID=172846 RepID=A0AAV4MDY4_CAEEX|nr:sulfotransferase family cytosolic 1B member 1 [Caerostris extrusa]